jgi:hypothetical protein
MAAMAGAYFTPTADPAVFVATGHTEGPWARGVQHAGPAAALLARAVEAVPPSDSAPVQVGRLTVDILGPVPVGEVRVDARLARPGRSVELVEGELTAGGRTAMTVRAWRVRAADLRLPAVPDLPPPPTTPPVPEPDNEPTTRENAFPMMQHGFLAATEWRFVSGGFSVPGPSVVWARHRVPLVAGERPSALQRLMPFADCGNGLACLFDLRRWWFINTELTVHLGRAPVGDWFCIRAEATADPSGLGLATTELFDEAGRLGRGAQTLLVGPR